jgi:hypothetical protein
MWEPAQAARFARDMRAIGRNVDDPAALAAAWELVGELKAQIGAAAQRLYDEGYSYGDLAEACGVKRQSIAVRWPQSAG